MTRKHFEAIASDIRHSYENADGDAERFAVRSVAAKLSVTFSIFNPNFDRARFLAACGMA